MRLRISSWSERLRSSLFFVPMASVLGAIVLSQVSLQVDSRFDHRTADLPLGLTSTVDSARAVLSTVAGATITFAGIAFSISLLIIQLGSSQYSPRVVHTLFRDPFNRRVMGLVVGTFTFCLMVLRSVRSALEEGGDPVIPNISVAVAVLLGVAAILAIVAFIDHSAHTMDISEILERVTDTTIEHVRVDWRAEGITPQEAPGRDEEPVMTVLFETTGWVQQIDQTALLKCAPAGGIVRLKTHPGRYAIAGTTAVTIAPAPDADDIDRVRERSLAAIDTGNTRTMQQDSSYGLRQIVDVSLKALSPGINDPTTAQDAIFHSAAVLAELLRRNPPPAVVGDEHGRVLVLEQQRTHAEMIGLCFDEVRRAAAAHPTVCVYLLESLELLHDSLAEAGLDDRLPPLRRQARLIVEGAEGADLLPEDLELVRSAYDKRFADLS
jgi:uncharacterized membrane protein